jgi:hypothetical protein
MSHGAAGIRRNGAANASGSSRRVVAGLLPPVRAIQHTGASTLEAITDALNDRGVRPARGTRWYASSVSNLLLCAQKLAEISEQGAI